MQTSKWGTLLACAVLLFAILVGSQLTVRKLTETVNIPGISQHPCVLLVTTATNDKTDDISEIPVIKESLKKGGLITIDVKTATELDPLFEEHFAISNRQGKYLTMPALLNWVAANGWALQSWAIPYSIFIKECP